MNLQRYLNRLVIPTEVLDKIMLILNFLGESTPTPSLLSYGNSTLAISALLQKFPSGNDNLSVLYQGELVLEITFREYSCITPLATRVFKRGYWEKVLDTIISSIEFNDKFNRSITP